MINTQTNNNMTTSEQALNGTVEIVKNWLSKGVSTEMAISKLTRMSSKELAEKVVRIAEIAL